MERKILLALVGFGSLVALSGGLLLLLPKEFVKQSMRFIMPLPPIAVAVYVYIAKVGEMNISSFSALVGEVGRMSLFVAVLYFLFSLLLYSFVKNL